MILLIEKLLQPPKQPESKPIKQVELRTYKNQLLLQVLLEQCLRPLNLLINWICSFFPATVIGLFLNLLSFVIFWKKEFNFKLYISFRVLTFVSMIIMLVASPYAFSTVKRLGFITFQNFNFNLFVNDTTYASFRSIFGI